MSNNKINYDNKSYIIIGTEDMGDNYWIVAKLDNNLSPDKIYTFIVKNKDYSDLVLMGTYNL